MCFGGSAGDVLCVCVSCVSCFNVSCVFLSCVFVRLVLCLALNFFFILFCEECVFQNSLGKPPRSFPKLSQKNFPALAAANTRTTNSTQITSCVLLFWDCYLFSPITSCVVYKMENGFLFSRYLLAQWMPEKTVAKLLEHGERPV